MYKVLKPSFIFKLRKNGCSVCLGSQRGGWRAVLKLFRQNYCKVMAAWFSLKAFDVDIGFSVVQSGLISLICISQCWVVSNVIAQRSNPTISSEDIFALPNEKAGYNMLNKCINNINHREFDFSGTTCL